MVMIRLLSDLTPKKFNNSVRKPIEITLWQCLENDISSEEQSVQSAQGCCVVSMVLVRDFQETRISRNA